MVAKPCLVPPPTYGEQFPSDSISILSWYAVLGCVHGMGMLASHRIRSDPIRSQSWVVMDLCAGGDLNTLLQYDGPLSLEAVRE